VGICTIGRLYSVLIQIEITNKFNWFDGLNKIGHLFDGLAVKQASFPAVGGVGDVETTKDFDSCRIPGERRMINSIVGPRTFLFRLPSFTAKIISLIVAQRWLEWCGL
jgi:hypothetical protein